MPTPIFTHFQIINSTHQGVIQTKAWYYYLHLCQEDPVCLCTQEGNINKGYYLPPDAYIGIIDAICHPVYILRGVASLWKHPLWCDDIHLYGTDVCLSTHVRILCISKPYFPEKYHIVFLGLFLIICNNILCSHKYYWNLLLYSMLTEAEFNGGKSLSEPVSIWKTHTCPWLVFYIEFHQGQSQEELTLVPLSIYCEG